MGLAAKDVASFVLIATAAVDEVFHVPQAQLLCSGDFRTWNPKITTFPGMYYLSLALHGLLSLSPSLSAIACSPSTLRLLNFGISCCIPFVAKKIRTQLLRSHRGGSGRLDDHSDATDDSFFVSIAVYLYPFSYLYYFLYYTDTCSTFFFLLAYLCLLRLLHERERGNNKSTLLSKLLLFASSSLCIFMRQTNAVWIMFLVGYAMLHDLQRRKLFSDGRSLSVLPRFAVFLWREKWQLVGLSLPMLVPVIAFAAFVVVNGGIVLGDKENHQPTIHAAMFVYPFVIFFVLSIPRLLISRFIAKQNDTRLSSLSDRTFSGTLFNILCVAIVGALAIFYGSRGHPFLLADNRHYSFYLWNRVLKHDHYRLLLSPLLGIAASVAVWDLLQCRGMTWLLILFAAASLSLLPTPLLEFRYFTPAVIVMILNAKPLSIPQTPTSRTIMKLVLAAEVAGLSLLNALVVYIFLDKTFTAVDGSVGRFMF